MSIVIPVSQPVTSEARKTVAMFHRLAAEAASDGSVAQALRRARLLRLVHHRRPRDARPA